jgi:hypothetical protein
MFSIADEEGIEFGGSVLAFTCKRSLEFFVVRGRLCGQMSNVIHGGGEEGIEYGGSVPPL